MHKTTHVLDVHDLAQHERPFSANDSVRYRLGGLVSQKYRERALALTQTGRRAQALRRCVTSRDGRLLFVKNYKAACTTGTELVHHYDNKRFSAHGGAHGAKDLAQGLSATRRHLAALDDPNAMRVTFVRDPLARLVSGFVMVFVKPTAFMKWSRQERGLWRLGYDPHGSVTRNFDLFLEYLEQSFSLDPSHSNPHWRRQVLNIACGEIEYGLIGRVERLRDDIRQLGEKLGHHFPDLEQGLGPRFNRGHEASSVLTVSAAQRARVRTLFAPDYEAFSY
jgi:Sulfotransferase family